MTDDNYTQLLHNVISADLLIRYREPDLPYYYIGSQMLAYLGYSSREEFILQTNGKGKNCIHPADWQTVAQSIDQQLDTAQEYTTSYRVRKKDGTYQWVQDRGRQINTPDGKTLILSSFMELSAESLLYHDILQQSTDGVYVIEQESHKLRYANNAMEQILAGVGIKDDYLGQPCHCVLKHLDQPCTHCFARLPQNEGEAQEIYLDFLFKYYSVVYHTIEWHGVPSYVIYLSDISEEKKANREIAQIYNNIPGAVFRCKFDKDWTIVSANEGLFEFLGYTRAEFAAMGNCMSAVLHPDDRRAILPALHAQFATGITAVEHEQRLVCKDKTVKWILLRGHLSENVGEGRVFYCVFVDISAQKKAQEELKKVQQKLTAAIDHAGLAYWEYDIEGKRAYLNAISTSEYALDEVLENYPESLYQTGAICQESIALYDSLLQAVQNGEPSASADLKTIDAKGDLVWKRVRFTTLFDEQNKPFWAVATAESINEYKELENRFSTVLEQNQIDTWTYDMPRNTIIQNHNTKDVYGVHSTEIPNVPDSLIERKLCHPDDAALFRDFYRRTSQGSKQEVTTVRLWDIRKNGYVWKRCTYTILPTRDGKPIYALGSAVDVSDQMESKRKYEEAIRYRYSTLGENVILAGHCNVTRNVILEVEDQTGLDVQHRFGMVREDFFRGLASLIPNEEQQHIFLKTFLNENMKNSFELGITQHDYDCTISLGEGQGIRWISTHVDTALQPETNDLIGFLTVTDVSASKMQEQVLDSVILFDYDFVAHLNLHSNTAVFYSSQNQMTPHRVSYKDGTPYCYTDVAANTAAHYLTDKDRPYYLQEMTLENVTRQLQDKDSYEFTYHVLEKGEVRTKQTRFAMHDRSAGIVIFSRADVTDMLAQQEKQKVALCESLAIAQQANNSKSKFLSSMSHDIRTPMNAITGMCSLAIADEDNRKQVHESLQVIQQSSALLLSMITDILDMNRIESGKTVLINETFSFSEQMKIARGRARALASKKQQQIKLSLAITHDHCNGDIVRIHRVIDNILANALKFTPEGGQITYRLTESETENPNIGLYRFEIADNGVGISPEQQKHIFEPFYRVQNSMTSQVEGAGLGLSIVKSIVDYMGGTIAVHSTPAVGTTFVIELPLLFAQNPTPREEKPSSPTRPLALSGVHVLLCEDHPINQLVATRILEKQGITVTVASNGQIGLERFSQSPPHTFDLILMDIQMPVLNGYDATRAIRQCDHPQAKTIPIIAMTANAFAEDVQKSMEAGMNDHLAKPIEPKQLYDTLLTFL